MHAFWQMVTQRVRNALDWPFVWRTVARLAPPLWLWFAASSIGTVVSTVMNGNLGGDAWIYAHAAHAWLGGGDPWHAGVVWDSAAKPYTVYYASTPTTLLIFAPFAYLADWVVAAIWIGLDAVVALLVIRRLQLPLWWLLWPPFVEATVVGNPEVVVLGLLVLAGGRLASVAPLVKIYAVVPLAAERRWRMVAISIALLGVTALILPWQTYIADSAWVAQELASQAPQGQSAVSVPILIPLVVAGLAFFGWRRAGWRLVPALWPATHGHYAGTALPAMTPLIAFVSLLPAQGAFALGIIAQFAFELTLSPEERTRWAHPGGFANITSTGQR